MMNIHLSRPWSFAGIKFYSEPNNVHADYGETVTINCSVSSRLVPLWTIGYSNGTVLPPSSSPPSHMSITAGGLDVTIQDFSLNISNYMCSTQAYDVILKSGQTVSYLQNSSMGVLTINYFSAIFSLISQSSRYSDSDAHVANITKGEAIRLTIKKEKGGSYVQYIVTVHSLSGKRIINIDSNILILISHITTVL